MNFYMERALRNTLGKLGDGSKDLFMNILSVETKGVKINYFETIEINGLKFSNLLLNDQLHLNNSTQLNLFFQEK